MTYLFYTPSLYELSFFFTKRLGILFLRDSIDTYQTDLSSQIQIRIMEFSSVRKLKKYGGQHDDGDVGIEFLDNNSGKSFLITLFYHNSRVVLKLYAVTSKHLKKKGFQVLDRICEDFILFKMMLL